MMKKLSLLMIISILGFLTGCAQMSPIGSVQGNEFFSAKLASIDPHNHDALAKHYEDAANGMKAKLQTEKKLLEEYEEHNYYYGRKGQDLRSHTWANIRHLEKSIKENLKEAAVHRKMAQDQQKQDLSLLTE
ncbi:MULTISPECIES: hypothetical protein [Nitrosomonas]|nr:MULTISPECIES: hypothetical protein [Nitrosomonas]UVS62870.1 hypothetical protein NX761_07125 [Nitrosomonas sp. PLL12]